MFTRFLQAQAVSSTHSSVTSPVDITFPSGYRQAVLEIFEDSSLQLPAILVRHNPTGTGITELLNSYGHIGGKYIAPMFGIGGATYRLSWSGGNHLSFTVRPQQHNTLLTNGASIGPFSISTQSEEADYPFTVVFTARPLFIDLVPLLTYYNGDTSTVTLANLVSVLAGLSEAQVIAYALDYRLKFELHYTVTATPGYVETIAFKTGYTTGTVVPVYTLVADITIGVPISGSQSLPDPIIVGMENPSNYFMRKYVPSRASCNSMDFVQMPPVALTAGKDEIQSSGRVIFERSHLYVGESYPMRGILTCNVLQGAGQVVVSPDYVNKFSELSEYEF